jgi:signal transduction histidine kinase/ActR/RegA family two-component response regulator
MAPSRISPGAIAPWLVLTSLLTITAFAAAYVWENSHLAARARFDRDKRTALDDIRFRIDTYVNVLRAAGGLFAAGENVTRDQFRSYVQALEIQRRHPGIQGIGLTLRVRPQHVADVIMDLRLNDFPEFKIWPEEPPREEYHAIVLLEPLDQRNRAAIGYDMFTNPVRREAMLRARDIGDAAASAPVRLVQELDLEGQRGFLIYVPVYTTGVVPQTVAERRDKLYGYVYAPFRSGDLFSAIVGMPEDIAFSIWDGDNLFYASTPRLPDRPRYEAMDRLPVAGRSWVVRFASTVAQTRGPMVSTMATAVGGIIISLLLFALLRIQLRDKARAEEIADTLRESEAELQAANRAKDEFLATLSHELRTPMTAIMGWSKLLGEELDEETREVAIDAIQKSSGAQAQLIEDLLDVSRITAGKMKIDPTPLELGPIIEVAAAAVAPAAESKGLNVEVDLPSTSVFVLGDAARLQQVIWNLMSNAVKFTPEEGSVKVRLRPEGDEAVLDVIDTGQGIAPEFLPYVFDRFRQADSSTTRAYTGLGLGLAIVRHLVELHGGTVAAHSDGEQKGSWFTVRLPMLRDQQPVRGGSHAPRDGALVGSLQGTRVLVVDDEDDVRNYAGAVFRMSGAEVRCERSADDALETMSSWTPDIVVTDIGMPERDGFDLLRAIREKGPVPVIALTAYARGEDRDRALEAGFEAFISKPVDPAELRSAVSDVLGEKAVVNDER